MSFLKSILFILLIYSSSSFSYAQCTDTKVTGIVVDTLNDYSYFYTIIYNKSSRKAFFGNTDGSFEFFGSEMDTIVISVTGYEKTSFVIETSKDCKFYKNVVLASKSKALKTVLLRPIKSLSEIKEQRQKLAMKTTRTVTGVEILNSPITYLYETFSRKERNKRWLAEQRFIDEKTALIKDYVKNCIKYGLIDLDISEVDEFITFLNLDFQFFRTASDYNLALSIKRAFELYKIKK